MSLDFSLSWLEECIKESELDVIVITNHNLFDIDNFYLIKEHLKSLKRLIAIYPGMEFDVEDFTGVQNTIVSAVNPKLREFMEHST